MRKRGRKAVLELTTRDVGRLMALVKEHVRPEQYKEGTTTRNLIEDVHRMSGENAVYTHYRVVGDWEWY